MIPVDKENVGLGGIAGTDRETVATGDSGLVESNDRIGGFGPGVITRRQGKGRDNY